MKRIHLIFGIVLFVVFVITGQYMRLDFPDKDAMSQYLRLLLRSRHIYIVFCSLIHLVLGVYLQIRPQSWRKILQYVGSALLASSALLLVFAFVQENYYLQHFSALSAFGVFSSLAGVGLHVIGGFVRTGSGSDRATPAPSTN